jgi:hypothetical protein
MIKMLTFILAVMLFTHAVFAQNPHLSYEGDILKIGDIVILRDRNYDSSQNQSNYSDDYPPLVTGWGEEIRLTYFIDQDSTYEAYWPVVSVNGDTLVLSYRYRLLNGDMGQDIIKSTDYGVTWSEPYDFTFPGYNGTAITDIRVRSDSIYLTGFTLDMDANRAYYFVCRSTNFGDSWEAPFFLNPFGIGFVRNTQLLLRGDTLHCIYFLSSQGYLFYRKGLNYGQDWLDPVPLTYLRTAVYEFYMENSQGKLHIVYQDYGDTISASMEVFHAYSADDGESWNFEMMSDNDDYHSQWPSFSVGENGEIIITWFDYKYGGGPSGFTGDVLGRISFDDGDSWSRELRLTYTNTATKTASFINGANIGVVWVDHRLNFFDSELYFVESADGGFSWSDEQRLTDAPHMSDRPVFASHDLDHILFWEDARDGNTIFQYEVYERFYSIETAINNDEYGSANDIMPKIDVYPNPFNSSTMISFGNLQGYDTEVEIFNLLGQRVRSFTIEVAKGGRIVWDATDALGNKVSSGIYFARGKASRNSSIIKLMYLK